MEIKEPYLINLIKKQNNKPGYLVSLEDYELNMIFKRIFWISGFENIEVNEERGNHGHKTGDQLIICLKGSINIETKNQNNLFKQFKLDNDEKGIYLPKNNIIKMKNISKDCLLLVACDFNYKDDILIT